MILVVQPTPSLQGSVSLPPSKSYSIRSVVIAACGGRSNLVNLSRCDDVKRAIKASQSLGASMRLSSDKKKLSVKAQFPSIKKSLSINVGESGTVLRFLLPLLALRKTSSVVSGRGTLLSRPNQFLTRTLRHMGKEVYGQGSRETVPVKLGKGVLAGGDVVIDGSLSSQFISALLIACPLLTQETRLTISGKTMVSKPYVAMTMEILKRAGIVIRKQSDAFYRIQGRQIFKGLKYFTIPSDYGLAAFLLAAGALTSSRLVLKGFFDDRLIQADGQILAFLKKMGVRIEKGKDCLRLNGPYSLKGGRFSLKDCPDLVPIMAILALFARRQTRLCDIAHARAKESDRISDLRRELVKVGARIREKKGELIIDPQPYYKQNVFLDPHADHRLAMAFAVLGIKIGVRISHSECMAKSYPEFVADVRKIGVKLKKG